MVDSCHIPSMFRITFSARTFPITLRCTGVIWDRCYVHSIEPWYAVLEGCDNQKFRDALGSDGLECNTFRSWVRQHLQPLLLQMSLLSSISTGSCEPHTAPMCSCSAGLRAWRWYVEQKAFHHIHLVSKFHL